MRARPFLILCQLLVGLGLVGVALNSSAAQQSGPTDKAKIKKCQDAAGKWHYGDTADEACRQSKIIEINKRGVETKQIAAPLTEDERKAKDIEEAEKQKAVQLVAERARQDKILLNTYANEADVTATRDRKLAEVDVQVRGNQETLAAQQTALARLQVKAKEESGGGRAVSEQTKAGIGKTETAIAKQEAFIQSKHHEQAALKQRFQADLDRFRQLKTKPADAR